MRVTLFCHVSSEGVRENGLKLHQGRLRLENNFFSERMFTHRSKLPRKAVESQSLEVFKANLDVALRDMV